MEREKTINDYYAEMSDYYKGKADNQNNLYDKKSHEEVLLYSLLYAQYSDVMYKELAKSIRTALNTNEFEKIRALLYQSVFMKNVPLPEVISHKYDHSDRFFEAMGYIACLGFSSVYRIFPEDISFCKNGDELTVLNSNLLLCILYSDSKNNYYDKTAVISNAEKQILRKSEKALRGITMCLLGVLKHDVTLFNKGFLNLLTNYNKIKLLNACEKTFCHVAVSLVVIAKKFLSEKEFLNINFPESNNLSWSYCEYIISRDSFEPKLYYEYPDNLSELNNLMLTPIPITKLTKEQAYRIEYEGLNKDDFKTILDSKGMLNNFILEYRKKNANNFVNIQIDE